MKIIADENLPNVQDYFHGHEIILKPGREIKTRDLIDADILLVRSVTRVNADLLQKTNIKFVGSATSGKDHLDIEYLNQAGIAWSIAEASNAMSVADYVICVVAALQKKSLLPETKVRAGVIGVGNIGSLVAKKLKALGFEVLLCDPLRRDLISTPIEKLTHLDFVTLHTPLTQHGPFPTYHMINKNFLANQKQNSILLNTSRGGVIDVSDLKEYGQEIYWCLDVWENEPVLDFDVLQDALIATPHIAGYSVQSKYRSMEMLYQTLLANKIIAPTIVTAPSFPRQTLSFQGKPVDWRHVLLSVFNPFNLTQEMKTKIIEDNSGKTFDNMRKHFNKFYEFDFVDVADVKLNEDDQSVVRKLGFNLLG